MVVFLSAVAFFKRAFRANAVNFDGTNDYMLRGAGLTGAADSSTGIFYCWFKTSYTSEQYLLRNPNPSVQVGCNSSNKFIVRLDGSGTLLFTSTNSLADGNWHSLLISWDTNFSAGSKIMHVYVDDASLAGSKTDGAGAFNVDYTDTNWSIGSEVSGSNKWNGDVAQFYFATGQFLDFSSSANRRLFINSTNKPVGLGPTGALPTGSQPIIFLDNPAASFQTNNGSGGNFTVTGTLTDASTSPSD